MRLLTLDVGGANLKFLRNIKGRIVSGTLYFPLWKRRGRLREALKWVRGGYSYDGVAVTMTAELSDAFRTKLEGIREIHSACEEVFEAPYYLSVRRELVREACPELAAANFVASLHYLERRFEEGVLLDIGSTTTDIVPFRRGERLYGESDLERLKKGQLLYQGFLRTPANFVSSELPCGDELLPCSAEYFAAMADVYRVLGWLDEKIYVCETPDARSKSVEDCMRRVARLLCCDLEELGETEVVRICDYLKEKQISAIAEKLREVSEAHGLQQVFVGGVGKRLGIEACERACLEAFDLSKLTEFWSNLPCLGLVEMLKEEPSSSLPSSRHS